MKKLFKIMVIGIFGLLLIALIAISIFIATFDIKRYKAKIMQYAEKSLGRSVELRDISLKLSFKQGVELSLADLRIGEHPDFGTHTFLSTQEINLGVSIADLFFNRQIRVLNVEIQKPQITIIRRKDGTINAQAFGETTTGTKKPQVKETQPMRTPTPSSAVAALPAISVNKIAIVDAVITFIDKTTTPELTTEVKKASLLIKDFSLTQEFPITYSAALMSDTVNIEGEAKGEVNVARSSFLIKSGLLRSNMSLLDLKKVYSLVPQLKNAPAITVPAGTFELTIKRLEVGPQGLSDLLVDIALIDSQIQCNEITPGVGLVLNQVSLNITDFTLNDIFLFSVQAGYLTANKNIIFSGSGRVNVDTQTVLLKDIELGVDLSSLSLRQLAEQVTVLKKETLPQLLKGTLELRVNEVGFGAKGVTSVNAQGGLREGYVQLMELLIPFKDISANFTLDHHRLDIKDLVMSLGKGTISAVGTIQDYLGAQNYTAEVKVAGVDISECVDQAANPVKARGFINTTYQVHGSGFDPKEFLNKLTAQGIVEVKEARLSDINLLKLVLDKIAYVPNGAAAIEENLPKIYRSALTQKDTVFSTCALTTNIKDGFVTIEPFEAVTDGFVLKGSGKVNFDQQYALRTLFTVAKDLSEYIVSTMPELRFLLTENAQLQVPLTIKGKGNSVSVIPDMQSIGLNALKNEGGRELEKVLKKVLKVEPENSQKDATDQPGNQTQSNTTAQGKEQRSDKEKLIDGLLDSIFKK